MGELSIESASSHARSTRILPSASRLFMWRDDLDYARILSQVSKKRRQFFKRIEVETT